ncbi:hypothetical protein OKA05_03670 [Luteolibacter arcticus]|uniref:Uncharacterized protein n=1 Tax=Luteolibacter arcticus TaxID=1581411 RepID=A0ABT3GDX0_9BACT|nr:hypothetical protein [Luteolibacter arcticus]MCW1921636.1 hypothetical protein [Luteolibacter arcticus]
MKTSRLAALAAASLATCAFVSGAAQAQTTTADPLSPVGVMTAFPTMVQTGTKPTLTWSIMHPARVGSGQTGGGGNGNGNGNGGGDGAEELAVVNPPGTIIPTTDCYVTVQIVGSGPTDCRNPNATKPPTDLRVSVNGSLYDQLFYGTQSNVNSSQKLFIKKVRAGQTVDFGGRFLVNGAWSPFYTTRSGNLQVVALVNGDTYPASTKFNGQAAMASYLKPYVDSSFKVKIGPLSVLLVMELAQTSHSSPCFDYQDQVVLVSLSRKHPNNGHGNNLDGVDSSNPGQGSGGPNGAVDPSGGYDDEMR